MSEHLNEMSYIFQLSLVYRIKKDFKLSHRGINKIQLKRAILKIEISTLKTRQSSSLIT